MINSRQSYFLIFGLFLVIVLARQFLPTPTRSVPASDSPTPYLFESSPRQIRIEGRWKSIRASLGLPPRSSNIDIVFPSPPRAIARASRFNLKRRRAIEESSSSQRVAPAQLHFSPDALEEQSVSLEALAESFRAVSLFEKEIAQERVRERLQRDGQGR